MSTNGAYRQLESVPLLGSLSVQHYELNNGLKVAIVVDRTAPILTYQTWYKTGSADEPAGKQGLAHLFEHMMFRKTRKREMGEFDRQVNINGGSDLNAYTSRDQTVYHFTFPNDKLELAADLEADRMVDLVIDDEMFETEKGAVLTEKQRTLDEPIRYLWEETYKLAYTTHNYKYSTIGETGTIKGFTVGEARDFYVDYYSPSNALVIVAGDVDPERVIGMIHRYYGTIPGRPAKQREVTTEPPQLEERFAAISHPKATQKMLAAAWHIPNMVHSDYPALAMVGKLLTSGKSAMLVERLVNASKVSSIYADAFIGRDLGTFEFFAQLAPDSTFDEVEQIFSVSMQELSEGKLADDQLEIVKNSLRKELYHTIITPSSLGQNLGDSFIYTNDLAYQINVMEDVRRVSREDLRRVIVKYILEGKATRVRLSPKAGSGRAER